MAAWNDNEIGRNAPGAVPADRPGADGRPSISGVELSSLGSPGDPALLRRGLLFGLAFALPFDALIAYAIWRIA